MSVSSLPSPTSSSSPVSEQKPFYESRNIRLAAVISTVATAIIFGAVALLIANPVTLPVIGALVLTVAAYKVAAIVSGVAAAVILGAFYLKHQSSNQALEAAAVFDAIAGDACDVEAALDARSIADSGERSPVSTLSASDGGDNETVSVGGFSEGISRDGDDLDGSASIAGSDHASPDELEFYHQDRLSQRVDGNIVDNEFLGELGRGNFHKDDDSGEVFELRAFNINGKKIDDPEFTRKKNPEETEAESGSMIEDGKIAYRCLREKYKEAIKAVVSDPELQNEILEYALECAHVASIAEGIIFISGKLGEKDLYMHQVIGEHSQRFNLVTTGGNLEFSIEYDCQIVRGEDVSANLKGDTLVVKHDLRDRSKKTGECDFARKAAQIISDVNSSRLELKEEAADSPFTSRGEISEAFLEAFIKETDAVPEII
ncbi:MAG: hypothetical protein K9M07_01260 [Simkaniaceae bacterium]|nr:hypothetical protein [Simkaniaceae bacterium]